MGCMGPSKDDSVRMAEAVYKELMEILKEKHNIDLENTSSCFRTLNEHLVEDKENLKKTLEDILWTYDCIMF